MLGTMDNATKLFTASKPASIGCADSGSDFLCQHSLTTPDSERVSIGWIGAAGKGWDGAQSLPRVITLDSHGLSYTPLPALDTLHENYHFFRHHIQHRGRGN
jgi:sucrose-6-phosphate hydrolase SacC (GH32 family)